MCDICRDLGEYFDKFGRIVHLEIKVPSRPPNFAFIEYGDYRDAEDAVRARDGRDFMGARLRVEVARGRPERRERFDDRGRGRGPPPNATGLRITVRGIPDGTSWQDLKDHFRKIAPPLYADVKRSKNGPFGVVEFETPEDMDRAIREMDGSHFRGRFGESTIHVEEDKFGPPSRGGGGGGPPRGRYRSRSPRGRRDRSYSPRRSRSPSPRGRAGSRSPSPRRRSSRSPSPRRRSSRSPSPRRRSSRSPSPRGRPYSRSPSPRARSRSRSPGSPRD
jgi:RNA recognition motif-containing protein